MMVRFSWEDSQVKMVKQTLKDNTANFDFKSFWVDNKGHAFIGGKYNALDFFIYRTVEELGDYSCALKSSLRDTGLYPVVTPETS